MRFKDIVEKFIAEGTWDEKTQEYYPSAREEDEDESWKETYESETTTVEDAYEETIFEYLLHPVVEHTARKIINQYNLQNIMDEYISYRNTRIRSGIVPTTQDIDLSSQFIDKLETNVPLDRRALLKHLATLLAEIKKYQIDFETFRKEYNS